MGCAAHRVVVRMRVALLACTRQCGHLSLEPSVTSPLPLGRQTSLLCASMGPPTSMSALCWADSCSHLPKDFTASLKTSLWTSPQYRHLFIPILEKRGSDRHSGVNGIVTLCQVIIVSPISDSNVCVCLCLCVDMCVCLHVCMLMHVRLYGGMCRYVCVCVCIHVFGVHVCMCMGR